MIACDEVLRQMLTLRIHLDEVTDENGPLRVMPGSHFSSTSEGEGLAAAVDIHASAGDVLAMRPLISHCSGSSKPGTQRHRRILHLEFDPSAKLPDAVQWYDFVAPDCGSIYAAAVFSLKKRTQASNGKLLKAGVETKLKCGLVNGSSRSEYQSRLALVTIVTLCFGLRQVGLCQWVELLSRR